MKGVHAQIGETDMEMFSATQFYQNSMRNALGSAAWGVSDIKVNFQSGVDQNSLTKIDFPSLVPGILTVY